MILNYYEYIRVFMVAGVRIYCKLYMFRAVTMNIYERQGSAETVMWIITLHDRVGVSPYTTALYDD